VHPIGGDESDGSICHDGAELIAGHGLYLHSCIVQQLATAMQ
jgi:hypothetical protein